MSEEAEQFRKHWNAFCDADHADCPIDFLDRAEGAGLIELVPVDDDALDEAFAWERGIERGGSMFQLTAAGHSLYAAQPPTKEPTP
jgi:hypothetical protein